MISSRKCSSIHALQGCCSELGAGELLTLTQSTVTYSHSPAIGAVTHSHIASFLSTSPAAAHGQQGHAEMLGQAAVLCPALHMAKLHIC